MAQSKRIYGLIGYPVEHSFSPAMHNAAFNELKRRGEIDYDAEYKLFEVKPQELEGFLNSLSERNISGLNVTIPYKEKVFSFITLDPESSYLRQIGAINTILIQGNQLKGFNTDISGFSKHLKERISPEGKKVAILGAGGASKAVTYIVAGSKPKSIVIYDIDINKTKELVNLIQRLFSDLDIKSVSKIEELNILEKDLLINATPVGMKESDACLIKKEKLHKDLFVYDLIYSPSETKLLKLAREKGCRYSNGLGMLLYQGMLSFRIWTGKNAPKEVMWQALSSQISTK
jgi:shikimate dehydrogenase